METAEIRRLMQEQLALSKRQQARIRELEDRVSIPLAVVGMGLRLPGGIRTPEQYWDFLTGDATAVCEIPADRPGLRRVFHPQPGRPGCSYVDRAAFLSDIASFDADFFGISRREAERLDPQQRLLLEASWEALERAGIVVRRADRLKVGVYLGMMASEYSERIAGDNDKTAIDPYYATGGGLCFGAGRISYVMGFSGPVVSVDTACSSSLSALHLAAGGLRAGECEYALVSGSNLLLSANLMVSLAQSRALAPDGRSKSFLAAADGYGRGEGVGVIVLMRLDDAVRQRRPILAELIGTAINHDGAASGLTVPSGPAQQEVIRSALRDARVDAAEVGYVEAHGTGTVLGDPIEINALASVLGTGADGRGASLAVGSVKSRLGHLEAASGVAGLMKVVLMLRHGQIPAARSVADGPLNPHIPWADLDVDVPTATAGFPAGRRMVAGVNSFGMSGTNAHAVLAGHDPVIAPDIVADRAMLLTVSARDPQALGELVAAVRGRLRDQDLPVADLCHTLRSHRAVFDHRVAVVGQGAAELDAALASATGRPAGRPDSVPGLVVGSRADVSGWAAAVAAVFPGLAGGSADDGPGRSSAVLRALLGVDPRPASAAAGVEPDSIWLQWSDGEAGADRLPLLLPGAGDVGRLLLEAVAALFRAGFDLRLTALDVPGERIVGDLPTYPFRRVRHWIEERQGPTAVSAPVQAAAPVGAVPDRPSRDEVAGRLLDELVGVLKAESPLDPDRSFLDVGGDSFLAMLYMTRIEALFPVGLTAEDLPTDLPLRELVDRLVGDICGRIDELPAPAADAA